MLEIWAELGVPSGCEASRRCFLWGCGESAPGVGEPEEGTIALGRMSGGDVMLGDFLVTTLVGPCLAFDSVTEEGIS